MRSSKLKCDEKPAGKISDDNKQKIVESTEVVGCLDRTTWTAQTDEYELEKVCNPIITKLYKSVGGMPGGLH